MRASDLPEPVGDSSKQFSPCCKPLTIWKNKTKNYFQKDIYTSTIEIGLI